MPVFSLRTGTVIFSLYFSSRNVYCIIGPLRNVYWCNWFLALFKNHSLKIKVGKENLHFTCTLFTNNPSNIWILSHTRYAAGHGREYKDTGAWCFLFRRSHLQWVHSTLNLAFYLKYCSFISLGSSMTQAMQNLTPPQQLPRKLHFNKIPRCFMCTVKVWEALLLHTRGT